MTALAVGLAAVLATSGCLGVPPMPSTSVPAGGPLAGKKIPVSIVTVDGTHPRPVVQVSVAGGPTVPMLLDSGSIGLRMFAKSVGDSGIKTSGTQEHALFGDGTVFNGTRAEAPAVIGGMPTAGSIQFEVVKNVGCMAEQPNCPGLHDAAGYTSDQRVDGIVGIGLNSAPVFNPLLQLDGGIPSTYTVSLGSTSGTIAFGSPPNSPVAAFPMQASADERQSNGAPAWNDQSIQGCWAFGSPQQSQCLNTTFDTGSVLTTASTSVPGAPPPPFAPDGLPLSLATSAGGTPLWSFTSGSTAGKNQVSITNSPTPILISGIAAFREFAITYDLPDGKVILAH